ncbi:MAG: carbohydrate binding domain-containing protein, partial [Thermoguttaceae bacterium]
MTLLLNLFRVWLFGLGLIFSVAEFVTESAWCQEQTWQLEGKQIWCREPERATFNLENGVHQVTNTSSRDWAVTLHDSISVQPGEIYRISGEMKVAEREGESGGTVQFTVGVFDKDNKIIDWQLGNAAQKGSCDWKQLSDTFVVPFGGVTLLPRLVGGSPSTSQSKAIKLEKLGTMKLLVPQKIVPQKGELDLLSPSFGEANLTEGVRTVTIDETNQFDNKPTYRISGQENTWMVKPTDPILVQPGEMYLVSLRFFLEQGNPELVIVSWNKNGLRGKEQVGAGTFRPNVAEEGGTWCVLHSYIRIPDGVDGIMPIIRSQEGGILNVAQWTIRRPTSDEIDPKRNKVNGYAKERLCEKLDRGLIAQRSGDDVYISWRLLETDAPNAAFDVFQIAPDGQSTKIN